MPEALRIVSQSQYQREKADRLAIHDLCTDQRYDVRLRVSGDPRFYATDLLSLITRIRSSKNHYDVTTRSILQDGGVSDYAHDLTVFPDGIVFRQTPTLNPTHLRGGIHECGYFLSAIDEWDIALGGLTDKVKNRTRVPVLR